MLSTLENAVGEAMNRGHKGLWASGDITWEFGGTNDFSKLLEYEWGLEELFRREPALCGICQYHTDTLPSEAVADALHAHEEIFINETLSRLNPSYGGYRSPRINHPDAFGPAVHRSRPET